MDYAQRLTDARSVITEITAEQLRTEDALVVDVREPAELAVGLVEGAVAIPMTQLIDHMADHTPELDTRIVLYCAVGERSAIAAAALQEAGYRNVVSLAGGIKRWMALGYPTESDSDLSEAIRRRYARHIVLPGVGVSGQRSLLDARILIVGAGGLGSPAALYLAAAGIGTIGLADDDKVELSNLQRQILHTTAGEGRSKAESGAEQLRAINPDIAVIPHHLRLSADNALDVLGGYDIIIDGTDNFSTRYLINDASMYTGATVVHGSIFRFEGQVAVFRPRETACYRCVFPEPPPPGLAPNCTEAGVFGVLPGVVGSMQATEALKLLLGIGEPLLGRLLTYDALSQSTYTINLKRRGDCASCSGPAPELVDLPDYC